MIGNKKPEILENSKIRPNVQKLQLTLLHEPQIDRFMRAPGQPHREEFSDDLEESLKSAFRYH